MSRKVHLVSPGVKADILRRIKDEGVSVSQAAKDHGIGETTIYGWLGKGIRGAPTLAELVKLKRENKQLLELVGELTVKLSIAQKKS
jgi:transposase-like protein